MLSYLFYVAFPFLSFIVMFTIGIQRFHSTSLTIFLFQVGVGQLFVQCMVILVLGFCIFCPQRQTPKLSSFLDVPTEMLCVLTKMFAHILILQSSGSSRCMFSVGMVILVLGVCLFSFLQAFSHTFLVVSLNITLSPLGLYIT